MAILNLFEEDNSTSHGIGTLSDWSTATVKISESGDTKSVGHHDDAELMSATITVRVLGLVTGDWVMARFVKVNSSETIIDTYLPVTWYPAPTTDQFQISARTSKAANEEIRFQMRKNSAGRTIDFLETRALTWKV